MDGEEGAWTVGEVATLADVTVRTLHHWDDVGVLTPSDRSEGGYRLYRTPDLERLHQILVLRELDVPLDDIRRILDDPDYDRLSTLHRQRERLVRKRARTDSIIQAVDAAIEALEGGRTMTTDELFDGFDPAAWEEEVEERWGGTEAFAESARRTARYGEEEWTRIREESDAILDDLARHLEAGRPASSPVVMGAAEAHRRHIDRWFYPCSREMHAALARMYVEDPRFRATFEERREGLAEYAAAAIRANGGREGG